MSAASRPTRPDGSPHFLTPVPRGGKSVDRPTNPSDASGARSSGADSRVRSSRPPRRSSSGYYSYDSESLPGSPLSPPPQTADGATQTPSPSAAVIEHVVNSLAHGRRERAHQQQQQQQEEQHGRGASSARPSNPARDMQAALIGQELRRHGDDFNRILMQRRQAARARPQWRPVVQQEPTVFICAGLLIFLFGRLLYTNSAAYTQSQV